MDKKSETIIAVGVCTYKRPKMLQGALSSVSNLKIPNSSKVIVIVVDNDKNQTAKPVIRQFENNMPFPLHYLVEEKQGISYARNLIVEEAISLGSEFLYFFDDDEWLKDDCLITHWGMMKHGISISIGPVISVYQPENNGMISRFRLHQCERYQTGKRLGNAATNNTLFSIEVFKTMKLRFDPSKAFTGGEDIQLTGQVSAKGGVIVWCDEAVVYETVPDSRVNLAWLLRRRYRTATSALNKKDKSYFTKMSKRSFNLFKSSVKHFFIGLYRKDIGKAARSLITLYGAFSVFLHPFLGQYEEYRVHHGE